MTRAVRFLALALVFSFVGSAMAQPEDSEGRPKRGPSERGERGGPGGPGGFRGGPGGFGGGPGGPGGGGLELYGNRQVHEELELSDEQRGEIREIFDETFKSMRDGPNFRELGDLPPEEQRAKMDAFRKKVEESSAAARKKIDGVLLDHQKKRLQEIRVQVQGAQVLSDKDVSTALGLSEDQVSKIKEITESQHEKRRESYRNREGRGNREEGKRDEGSREDGRERFEKLRKENDAEVMAVLTSDQKAKLEEMKGKKFEMQPPPRRGEGEGFRRGRGEGRGEGEKGGKSRGERRSRDSKSDSVEPAKSEPVESDSK